jgi:hypothetical protein
LSLALLEAVSEAVSEAITKSIPGGSRNVKPPSHPYSLLLLANFLVQKILHLERDRKYVVNALKSRLVLPRNRFPFF